MRGITQSLRNAVIEAAKLERLKFNSSLPEVTDFLGRTWSNSDNIAFGQLGRMLFLLELARQSGDEEVIEQLRSGINQQVKECSSNLTLMYGRVGLGLILLELFELTKDDDLLRQVLEIMPSDATSPQLYISLLNNNSLYDGASGVVVFYTKLYNVTRAEWIIPILEKYADKFLRDILNCRSGYFIYESDEKRRLHAMAYGDLGCCLALLDLYKLSENPVFLHMAKGIINFQTELLDQKGSLEDPVILYLRTQELGMIKLIYQQALGSSIEGSFKETVGDIDLILDTYFIDGRETDLAYLNLIFIQCNAFVRSKELSEVISKVTARLTDRMENVDDPGFLTGRLGIMYSILKSVDRSETAGSIIHFPVNTRTVAVPAVRKDSVLRVSFAKFNHLIIEKDLPYTLSLLGQLVPERLTAFLETYHHNPVDALTMFVRECDYPREKLALPFEQELDVFHIKSGQWFWDVRDHLHNISVENEVVISTDDDFSKLQVMVAPDVFIYGDELPCRYNREMTADEMIKLGSGSFFLRKNFSGQIESLPLEHFKLILDALGETGQISDAMTRCENFIEIQGEETRRVLAQRQWTYEGSIRPFAIARLRHLLAAGWITLKE